VAEIAETVVIGVHGDGRIKPHAIPAQQIGCARWIDAQREDHRCWVQTIIGNLVARTNLHGKASPAHQRESPTDPSSAAEEAPELLETAHQNQDQEHNQYEPESSATVGRKERHAWSPSLSSVLEQTFATHIRFRPAAAPVRRVVARISNKIVRLRLPFRCHEWIYLAHSHVALFVPQTSTAQTGALRSRLGLLQGRLSAPGQPSAIEPSNDCVRRRWSTMLGDPRGSRRSLKI
jgi:hypothetical protein